MVESTFSPVSADLSRVPECVRSCTSMSLPVEPRWEPVVQQIPRGPFRQNHQSDMEFVCVYPIHAVPTLLALTLKSCCDEEYVGLLQREACRVERIDFGGVAIDGA